MNELPVRPLSELVSDSGGILLPFSQESRPSSGDDPVVKDIALYEPGRKTDYQGRLVLVAARVADRFALERLLEEAGTAAGLVLPPDAARDLVLPGDNHPTVFRRSPWVGWSEVFRMLVRALGTGTAPRDGLQQLTSLTDVAAWIADLTGTSVTIEDLESRLVAYSAVNHAVDTVRSQTILAGAVPPWRLERLMSSGFLPAVWRSDDVVVREAEDDDPARMVVAVRSDGEALGTIWALLRPETDRDRLRSVLLEARALTAAMLGRELHRSHHARRMRETALTDLLRGEMSPLVPVSLLGLDREHRHVVAAVAPGGNRGHDVVFHLQAAHPGSLTVPGFGVIMVILPVRDPVATPQDFAAALKTHLSRVMRTRGVMVGLGPIVNSPTELSFAATAARDVLRAMALKAAESETTPRVAIEEQVDDAAVLVRASDLLQPLAGDLTHPLRVLRQHDPELVRTLREVMRFPGNLTAAARDLGIHSNSLRYRLTRIHELSGIDVHDPESRLRTALAFLLTQLSTSSSDNLDEKSPNSGD